MTDNMQDPRENVAQYIERSARDDDETHDAKGRPVPRLMLERKMLEEILLILRTVADTVEELSEAPMVKALQNGGNPILAMMGRG